MPRDGSGIYSKPFPDVVPGTTIESAVFNGNTADVEQDLNAPRPIIAGGTGASSATDALFNLKGEMAAQLVTNFDSHLWVPGSFRSAAGATGAPNADNAFAGVCYIGEALANPPTNQNVVIEARDLGDASVPGLVYVREKLAGVWSAWVANPNQEAIDDALEIAVKVDADQAFTEAQKAQGRENIYAAPFDALAYNGMQVNGAMEIDQIGTGTVADGGAATDMWRLAFGGTMQVAVNRILTVGVFPGMPNYLSLTVNTAQPSLTGTNHTMLQHRIEGYRTRRLGWGAVNAKPLTIGFWSNHTRTGLYSVQVSNPSNTRNYVSTYTQAVSDVSQYNVATVPGCVDGVWPSDNTTSGFNINFVIACGPTLTAPAANVWNTTNYIAAPGQVNGVTATSDTFRITGVVVLPGIEAPSAERSALIMRPYDQELVTCQRYWEKGDGRALAFTGHVLNGAVYAVSTPFRVVKRAPPTTIANYVLQSGQFSGASPGYFVTERNLEIEVSCTGDANYAYFFLTYTADARL